MKIHETKGFRLTILDDSSEMKEIPIENAVLPSLGPGPAERIGREEMVTLEKLTVVADTTRFGKAPVFSILFLEDVRRRIIAYENEMMLEAMGVSMKQKKNRDQQHDKGAKRVVDSPPPGRFSGPHGMTGPGPIHSPRNMMLITEQSPEKPPMTRAERRRAEKMKRKP